MLRMKLRRSIRVQLIRCLTREVAKLKVEKKQNQKREVKIKEQQGYVKLKEEKRHVEINQLLHNDGILQDNRLEVIRNIS